MKFAHILIAISLFLGCRQQEDPPEAVNPLIDTNPLQCLESNGINNINECDISNFEPTEYYCDQVYAGKFTISDKSKSILAEFCLQEGDQIQYFNAANEVATFSLSSKSYSSKYWNSDTRKICPNDADKTISYCHEDESIWININSLNSEIEFNIFMGSWIKYDPNTDIVTSGDMLAVTNPRIIGISQTVFTALIDQGDLDIDGFGSEIYHSEIELLGKKFENVITNHKGFHQENHQIFYNESGLIAFIDKFETLWVRE